MSVCIRIQEGAQTRVETAMFGTFTTDLERMRNWLQQHNVEHVAMESTGVFWIPVWNVLERAEGKPLALTLINPQHVHALPGRKTDQQDCERIAELRGFYSDHFRWLLGGALQDLQHMDRKLGQLDRHFSKQLHAHADLIRRLCTIPGVDFTAAAVILAEIGFDMTRFPDAAHLASWAGLCPWNNESAGKRFSARTRKGNRYLRRVLTQSAWSLTHKKDCSLTGYRVASRGGMKKAALAVAHRILTIIWHIVSRGTTYYEVGGNPKDRQQPERTARRLARRLQAIGFEVAITPKGSAVERVAKPSTTTPAPSPRPRPLAADPATCSRCAKWGIACIHARNAKLRSASPAHLKTSTT